MKNFYHYFLLALFLLFGSNAIFAQGVAEAEELLAKTGVGYPKSNSSVRAALQTAVDEGNATEIQAAITNFKSSTDIQMPENGKSYRIVGVQPSNDFYFYMNANGLQLTTTERTSDDAVFVCEVKGSKYAFKNVETGAYLISKNGTGHNSDSGHLTEYNATYCDFSIYSGNTISHEKAFGSVAIVGKVSSTGTYSPFTINPSGNVNRYSRDDGEAPTLQINSSWSTVNRLIEVPPAPEFSSLEEIASDYVCIVTDRADGKVLTEDNNTVHLRTYEEGNDYQLWKISSSGTQYTICNKATGRYIDRQTGTRTDAMPTNASSKAYSITSVASSTEEKPLYNFFHPNNLTNCLFYNGSSDALQVATLTADAEGYAFGFFKPTFVVPAISLEEILAANHGLVRLGSNRATAEVAVNNDNKMTTAIGDNEGTTTPAQIWLIEAQEGGGYTLRSMSNGKYMQNVTQNNTSYPLGDEGVTVYIQESDVVEGSFVLSTTSTFDDYTCLHHDGSDRVVRWHASSTQSAWNLKPATDANYNTLMETLNPTTPQDPFEAILAENDGLVHLYSNMSENGNYLAAIPNASEDTNGNTVPVNGSNVNCTDNSGGGSSHVWRFEAQEGGGYLLRSMYTGQYLKGPANSDDVATVVNSSSAASTYYVKLSEVEGCDGRFVISSTSDFADGTCLYFSNEKIEAFSETSAQCAWRITAFTDYTLQQLENMLPEMPEPPAASGLDAVLAQNHGLVRLYSTYTGRGNGVYLATQNGDKMENQTYNATSTAQVWQIVASGDGYTLRSYSSAKYVSAVSSETSLSNTPLTLYIKDAAVDGFTDNFVISSSSTFAGNSFLMCSDAGIPQISAGGQTSQYATWRIEAATDADYNEMGTSTAYYKIVSTTYENHCITEMWGNRNMKGTTDNTPSAQIWKFTEREGKTTIQSIGSKLYIQGDPGQSADFRLGEEPTNFEVSAVAGQSGVYTIRPINGGGRGLHEGGNQDNRIVSWDASAEASKWYLQEQNLTEDQVAQYEAQYQNAYGQYTNAAFLDFFSDAAATQLKSEYQNLTDAQLRSAMSGMATELQDIAVKVKNNSWANSGWEKHFRVAKYGAFSDAAYWAGELKTQQYGVLNNPTGIVADNGDNVIIIVGSDIPTDATLRVETRTTGNIRTCNSDGSPKLDMELRKGLNYLQCTTDNSHVYITYLSKNGEPIAKYPELDIHVSGGDVQGYFDIKKHTASDWTSMRNAGLFQADAALNLLGNYTQLYINLTAITAKGNESNLVPLIELFDWYAYVELDLLGITAAPTELKDLPGADAYEDLYPKYVNNRMLCIGTGTSGVMHGGNQHICMDGDGTYYYDSLKDRGSSVWGFTHEFGHVNQGAIHLVACTERSNNLFANVAVYKGGTCTSRGENLNQMQRYMSSGEHSWISVLGGTETVKDGVTFHAAYMWYQLYLYYHAAGNDPFFYQKLFKLLRENPIKRTNGNIQGTEDYLHFALMACKAANEDLTDFFEYWGFFEPVDGQHVAEYGFDHTLYTTQNQIDGVKSDMAKYAKKGNAGMIFIDDRAVASYKPDGTQKDACDGQTVDKCAAKLEGAQYSSFNGNKTYPDRIGYTLSGNRFTVSNTAGASGFKFYNAAGKLIYAASNSSFDIPYNVFQNIDHSKTVAAFTDGTTLPLYNTADNGLYRLNVVDGTGRSSVRYTKGGDAAMLSKERDGNAIAQLYDKNGSAPANVPASLSEAENVVVGDKIHHLHLSDKYDYVAQAANYTAENITYTDRLLYDGWNTLCLPFAITKADLGEGARIEVLDQNETSEDVLYFNEVARVEAGQPCLVWLPGENGNWTCTKTGISLVGAPSTTSSSFYMNGNFEKKNIGAGHYKLNASGTAFGVTSDAGVSYPFRAYVSTNGVNNVRTLRVVHDESGSVTNISTPTLDVQEGGVCYDLQGRKVKSPKRGEIYILGGKKVFFK